MTTRRTSLGLPTASRAHRAPSPGRSCTCGAAPRPEDLRALAHLLEPGTITTLVVEHDPACPRVRVHPVGGVR